jgi:ankyrin repeat protein
MKKLFLFVTLFGTLPLTSFATSLCKQETMQFAVNHSAAKLYEAFKAGENPNCVSEKGVPLLLHSFLWSADPVTVETILDNGGDANASDKTGRTSLHLASWLDSSETINVLIKSGANIEAKTSSGSTPLFIASQSKSLDALKTLIDFGANPNVAETKPSEVCLGDGWSNYAYIKRTPIVAAILSDRENYCHVRRLVDPVKNKVIETIQMLLLAGANINQNTDTSALGVASYFNSEVVVGFLLKNGADVNGSLALAYKPNANLLFYTIGLSDMSIIEKLLAMNPALDGVSSNGSTLYHAAILRKPSNPNETAGLVERLYKSIPHLIDQGDDKGFTPLMKASYGSLELIKTLIRLGADPKKVNYIGDNANCFTGEGSEQDNFYLSIGVKCGRPR